MNYRIPSMKKNMHNRSTRIRREREKDRKLGFKKVSENFPNLEREMDI